MVLQCGVLLKLGPGRRMDRASSGKDSATHSKACAPRGTEAHSRGRAGVGQAEGLEQQEKQVSSKTGEEGCLYDALLGDMQEHLFFPGCGVREARVRIPALPQSWLRQVKELTPGHTAAKRSAGIQTHSARLRQSLPCLVSFLCLTQA